MEDHVIKQREDSEALQNIRRELMRSEGRITDLESRNRRLGESNRLLILEVEEKRSLAEKINSKFAEIRAENSRLKDDVDLLKRNVSLSDAVPSAGYQRPSAPPLFGIDTRKIETILQSIYDTDLSLLPDLIRQCNGLHSEIVRLADQVLRSASTDTNLAALENECRAIYRKTSEMCSILQRAEKERHEDFVKLRLLVRECMDRSVGLTAPSSVGSSPNLDRTPSTGATNTAGFDAGRARRDVFADRAFAGLSAFESPTTDGQVTGTSPGLNDLQRSNQQMQNELRLLRDQFKLMQDKLPR
jgi:hypothetical protein